MRNARSRVNIDRPDAFGGFKTPRRRNALRSHNRPQPDILRAYAVGIILMAAFLTAEVQAFPVRCRDFTTSRTAPAGVFGIDLLKADPSSRALVGNKELPLCIWPAVNLASQVFPLAQRTVSDVAEVFNGNRSCAIGDRVSNQLFRRPVEHRHCYSSLVTAHASEKTTRGTSANRLNGRTFASDAGAAMVFHPAFEKECPVVSRVGGDQKPLDSEIHADNAAFGLGFWNLDFVSQAEEPLLPDTFDLGVFPSSFGNGGVPQNNRTTENSDSLLVLENVAAVGQWHSRTAVNSQVPFARRLHGLVAGRHLAEQRTGELGGNLKFLSDYGVEGTGQSIGVQLLGLKDLSGYPAGSGKVLDADSIQMRSVFNFNLDRAGCFQYKQAFQKVLNMSNAKNNPTRKDGLKAVVSTQQF
jgi:hypothetical protein